MIFAHFLIDVNESNSFVVGCEDTREALLVDVAALDPRIEAFLKAHELNLSAIFITHDHYDHTGGLGDALAKYDATIYAGASPIAGVPPVPLGHGDPLRFGNIEGKAVQTPGHTPNSISLILPGMAFTGDALFSGSVGGTTTAANAKKQVDHIRKHIFCLPDDCQIHTGHGPSSTVGIEKQYNPFFV